MKKWVRKLNRGVFWEQALKLGFWGMIIEVPIFLFSFFYFINDISNSYLLTWIYCLLVFVSVISLTTSIGGLKKSYKKLAKKVLITSIISLVILVGVRIGVIAC